MKNKLPALFFQTFSDEEIFNFAQKEERIIVSANTDLGTGSHDTWILKRKRSTYGHGAGYRNAAVGGYMIMILTTLFLSLESIISKFVSNNVF